MPRGPFGAGGYPGSTRSTRTFGGNDPRTAGLRTDTNSGWESGLSERRQVRQAAYRGDIRGAATANPTTTGSVSTPQPQATALLQGRTGEFFGGPMLRTGAANNTAGANPLTPAQRVGGHSNRDTRTPANRTQPIISVGTPGANNVRNTIALRYKAKPGDMHTYKSASRADTAPVNRGGQATDGNVHPDRVVTDVTVPSRYVGAEGGVTSWSVLRQMPYTGRGDGARGAELTGQRYYATGQSDQFLSAGQGDYGIARQRGRKRPVSFTTPAPWATNFYDTTSSVGTIQEPGEASQSPNQVYMSPSTGRATNRTGRLG
jgi:hypothetical protein